MSAHEIHALSGAYAMDALDDLERIQFEKHLAACAECRAEVAGLRDTTTLLSNLSATAPPAALRDRLLADIKTVRPLPPLPVQLPAPLERLTEKVAARRPRRWSSLVAAAAVLGVLGGGAAVVTQLDGDGTSQSPDLRYSDAAARVVQAADVEHVNASLPQGASATVFRSATERAAVLVTRNMPSAPSDKIYQLWLQKGGRMVPAGTMTSGGNHTILLKGDARNATGVGVTVEPEGGSEAPTTAPVALFEFETA